MSISDGLGAQQLPEPLARRRRLWPGVIRDFGGLLSLVVLVVIVITALAAPTLVEFQPDAIGAGPIFGSPSADHWFGTDELGRDVYSRVLYGGRISLAIAVTAMLVAVVLGTIWGGLAASLGGWYDELLMRLADLIMAIPLLLLALILAAAFGVSTTRLAIIIGLVHVPWTARIIRSGFLDELKLDYTTAAIAIGSSRLRLNISEVLPNVTQLILIQASLVAASAIVIESTLSFVGLGVQPPSASWATLVLQGYQQIYSSYTAIIFPGLMIFFTVWALNSFGDSLQRALIR